MKHIDDGERVKLQQIGMKYTGFEIRKIRVRNVVLSVFLLLRDLPASTLDVAHGKSQAFADRFHGLTALFGLLKSHDGRTPWFDRYLQLLPTYSRISATVARVQRGKYTQSHEPLRAKGYCTR